MNRRGLLWAILSAVLLPAILSGCGVSSKIRDVNLVFVVSEDLHYNAPGDIDPATANLTDQGLQRTLLMATYLQKHILESNNVSGIYALEPMTHLQTPDNYPDIVPLWTVQQFAMLNQVKLSTVSGSYQNPSSVASYPLNASYSPGSVPSGVAAPETYCAACQGIDFNDTGDDNESLLESVISANVPGYYVFSAPWETVSGMMSALDSQKGYNLSLPSSYQGPNYIYVISIPRSGTTASLDAYNSAIQPASAYPALPGTVATTNPCTEQAPFRIVVTGGRGGAVVPSDINTNETAYMIRHAESGGKGSWDDGNYNARGQWRALDLPAALAGKISPDRVYSIDPAQYIAGTEDAAGNGNWSYVRAALTAEPYAIARGLPFSLAANFEIFSAGGPAAASDFFFKGGRLSNEKVLISWEHTNITNTVNSLIASYYPSGGAPAAPQWPGGDFDTIWTVALDGRGDLTVSNASCEGIKASALPSTPPQF